MNKEKLAEIGEKLNVPHSQIKKINKQHRKQNIYTILVGGITSLISLLTGYFIGKSREPRMEHHGYPYAIWHDSCFCSALPIFLFSGTVGISYLFISKSKHKQKLLLVSMVIFFIILSVLAYIFGQDVGCPVEYYSGAIEYGVYSKEE